MNHVICFDFSVAVGFNVSESLESSIVISGKEVEDVVNFVIEHPTGELVDLPERIYGRFEQAAVDAVCSKYGVSPELVDGIELPKYLPSDLIKLLPVSVQRLLPLDAFDDGGVGILIDELMGK